MQAKLVVVGGDTKITEVDLKLPVIIGRGQGSRLRLQHALVSRQHCELFEHEGQLKVRDLGSLNGTFVNNERITEALLPPGQLLTVGAVTFRAVYEIAAPTMPVIDTGNKTVAIEGPAAVAEKPAVPETPDFVLAAPKEKIEAAPAAADPMAAAPLAIAAVSLPVAPVVNPMPTPAPVIPASVIAETPVSPMAPAVIPTPPLAAAAADFEEPIEFAANELAESVDDLFDADQLLPPEAGPVGTAPLPLPFPVAQQPITPAAMPFAPPPPASPVSAPPPPAVQDDDLNAFLKSLGK